MAALSTLPILLNFTSVTADRLTGTVTDVTVYGGSYPARSSLDVFASMQKMKYDSSIDTTLTVTPNSTPRTASTFNFNILKDGWTRILFVVLPAYAGGTTYAQYDAVYNSANDLAYISVSGGNTGNALTNPTFWTPLTDPSQLALNAGAANQSNNIASQIYQFGVEVNSEYAFAQQIAITSTEGGDADREKQVQLYELLAVWLDGMYIEDDRSEFARLERLARRFQSVAVENGLL